MRQCVAGFRFNEEMQHKVEHLRNEHTMLTFSILLTMLIGLFMVCELLTLTLKINCVKEIYLKRNLIA